MILRRAGLGEFLFPFGKSGSVGLMCRWQFGDGALHAAGLAGHDDRGVREDGVQWRAEGGGWEGGCAGVVSLPSSFSTILLFWFKQQRQFRIGISDGRERYIVCEYFPAGNVLEHFQENVRPQLPDGEVPAASEAPSATDLSGATETATAEGAAGRFQGGVGALWLGLGLGVVVGV